MGTKRSIVVGLNTACTAVDSVAYRPAVVKLTSPLPRWWRCDLARLSIYLDARWGCGYWDSDSAPARPEGLCEVCQRRAAWLVRRGYDPQYDDEPPDADDYTGNHPIHTCAWCQFTGSAPIDDPASRTRAFADARDFSISWRWRWKVL